MLKNGKTAGEDGMTNEMAKNGGLAIVEWSGSLFNLYMNMDNAAEDWRSAIVVPLFKSKGDKKECKNYNGISLLNTPGIVYGIVLVLIVSEITEGKIKR
jgi:hypothetical protein